MTKNKLTKFAMNRDSAIVIEQGKEFFDKAKGNWRKDFFLNDKSIVLEIACGRGEYTVGLGEAYPDVNFIGVDIKGARIWKGNQAAEKKGLKNVAFLRTYMHEIHRFFDKDEVDEIWIIHPDPRPKDSDIHRRLTHPRYLGLYRDMLKKGGLIHLKTDSDLLYEYTLEVIEQEGLTLVENTNDLHQSPLLNKHHGIQTWYERIALEEGRTIKYLEFKL